MDDGPLGILDLKQCHLHTSMHMSLTKGGCTYVKTCVEFPRLQKWEGRDTGRSPWWSRWTVDGIEIANLADAVVWLNRSREENEAVADEREKAAAGSTPPKWRIADGLAECERELQQRSGRYAQLIGRGALTEIEANQQNAALQGTIRFLQFCKDNEAALREFMSQAVKAKADAAVEKQGAML